MLSYKVRDPKHLELQTGLSPNVHVCYSDVPNIL